MRHKLENMGQLVYNKETAEGEINIPEIQYDQVGLDILHDWISDLQALYDEINEEVRGELQR